MSQTRLLIVDDHAIVRKGILMFLRTEPTVEIIGEAEDGADGIQMAIALNPDVILMDLVMPGKGGTEAITEIKRRLPDIKIIVLTTFNDEGKFSAAMAAGADGYMLKDADGTALLQAIQAVMRGEMPLHPAVSRYLVGNITNQNKKGISALTDREKEVLELVARGWSNQAVAQSLNLSKGTIKVHMSNILGKLNVASRTEAAMLALQTGMISLE